MAFPLTTKNADYGSINVLNNVSDMHTLSVQQRNSKWWIMGGALVTLSFVIFTVAICSHNSMNQNGMSMRHEMWTSSRHAVSSVKTLDDSSEPRFFKQRISHFHNRSGHWDQRYYAKKEHWKGPGHPIFIEVGGEGGNDVGFFYPFIDDVMAELFGAYALHPEHRFYGISYPIHNATVAELLELLTPEQAMKDMVEIVQHYRKKLGCSMKTGHKKYCPVIAVGGSYPGFLAAMMRFLYPGVIDIGYASSAPLKLYSHQVDQWGYFDIVTTAAERVSPGCSHAAKQALTKVHAILQKTKEFHTLATDRLGICPGTIPNYINSGSLFSQELMQIIETTFADANMIGNYPPSNNTWLAQLCHVFQYTDGDALDKVKEFWKHLEIRDDSIDCFRMDFQLSAGPNATVSSSDWSGLGPGVDGYMWDFQCCMSLIPEMGFSEKSMFPKREWTFEWLKEHCVSRFGIVGDPMAMVNQWKFDDLVGQGASRILFTNGFNDMWMYGGYTKNLSDSLVAVNFVNGGHHSEVYARIDDTTDVKKGQKKIVDIFDGWLTEIKKES